MHLHVVHRVGKALPATGDGEKATPWPVIVRFLLRGDKDKVMNAKNKLKKKILKKKKILIKAMFKAKERGLRAKVVNRNLIVENTAFHDNVSHKDFKLL